MKNLRFCIDCKKQITIGSKLGRCKSCNGKFNNPMKGKIPWNKNKPFMQKENHPNWNRIERKCDFCQKSILITQKRNRLKHIFCSRECELKWRTEYYKGENNWNYIDGRSSEKYPQEFRSLRNKIRERDDYICKNCGMVEEEHLIVYGRNLEIHHIDYNRKNSNENNLITLCRQCNMRANKNRDYWVEYYTEKMNVNNNNQNKN